LTFSLFFSILALSDHYLSSSKTLSRLSNDIHVPLHDSALFIPQTSSPSPNSPNPNSKNSGGVGGISNGIGLQSLLFEIRDRTRLISNQHLQLSKDIESKVAEPLRKLRVDIKSHVAELEKEVNKCVDKVEKERSQSEVQLTQLGEGLNLIKTNPLTVEASSDPYVVNKLTMGQMRRQVEAENELIKSTLYWQNKSKEMELEWVDRLKKDWEGFSNLRTEFDNGVNQEWLKLQNSFANLPVDLEWNHFAGNLPFLLKEDTPLRSLDAITYPGMNDEHTLAVKSGLLSRKKRLTRAWTEGSESFQFLSRFHHSLIRWGVSGTRS
jgi:hypothetical protein